MSTRWAMAAAAARRGRATLRVFDGRDPSADDPGARTGRGAAAPRDPRAAGHPAITFRVDGRPIELRIWTDWPRGEPDAVRHPSGAWFAMRAL